MALDPLSLRLPTYPLDAGRILRAALNKSNSRSVSHAKNESASTSRRKSRETEPLDTFHFDARVSTRAHKIHVIVKFVLFLQDPSAIPYSTLADIPLFW